MEYYNPLKEENSWTYYKCNDLFGHKACLELRRNGTPCTI
jgi:hypothetical protein